MKTLAGNEINIQFIDSSGNVETGADYESAQLCMKAGASFTEEIYTGQTSLIYSMQTDDYGSANQMNVYNPFDSGYTYITSQTANMSYLRGYKRIGVHKLAESMAGLKFTFLSNAQAGSTVSVFGVK